MVVVGVVNSNKVSGAKISMFLCIVLGALLC